MSSTFTPARRPKPASVREGLARVLGVQVDLHHVVVGDHEDAPAGGVDVLPELLSVAAEAVDQELRAVPPGLFLGVDRLEVGRIVLGLFGNLYLLTRDAGVDAVEDHGHAQPPRVHDPGLAQHREQLGGAPHRLVGRAAAPPRPRPVRSASPPSTVSLAAMAASFITVSIVPSTGSRTEE